MAAKRVLVFGVTGTAKGQVVHRFAHWCERHHSRRLSNVLFERDFLYNPAGTATLRDATGQSGSYVGDEIDFRFNIHVDRHEDVLIGYSKLFAGDFLKAQAPRVPLDLYYVQYNFRF